MPYIGNPIYQSAFVTDQFSGNGSTTAFTMSVAPAGVSNVLVAVSGVLQDPSTYGVVGNTLTFSAAPPSGTGNISCRYLGVPATGVVTTAYRTVTEFTATAGQTTFTPPSYNVGFINVYLNGVLLGSADYTATNGTTVVLATGASAGNLVTVESFRIESVANAIPNAAGAINLAGTLITGTLPVSNGGTGVTTSTGSGNNVLSTSPTLVTPNLGTPSTINLSNATALPVGALPVGSIKQVVNVGYGTQTTTSSATSISSGLTASITPTSASSKVLVFINCSIGQNGSTYANLGLWKNGSALITFAWSIAYTASGSANYTSYPYMYLDSPASTSSQTYAVYFNNAPATGTTRFNSDGSISTITLMEIAA